MHRLTAKLEEHWVLSLQLSSIFTWLDYSRLMSLVKEVPSKAGSHDVEKGQSGSGLDFEIAVDFDSLNLVAFPGISDTTAFVCTMQSTGSTPFGSIKEHCLRILSLHGTLSLNAQARSLSVHTTTENAASEFLRTNGTVLFVVVERMLDLQLIQMFFRCRHSSSVLANPELRNC